MCEGSPSPLIDAEGEAPLACLVPAASVPISAVRVQALRYDGECVSVLCIGYIRESEHLHDADVTAADFADRFSLILANLKQAERLHRQANFDALTGLQNRQLFSDHVRTAVVSAQATNAMGSLLYIDLDHFKHVNATAGHAAGDALLRIVAQRLIGRSARDRASRVSAAMNSQCCCRASPSPTTRAAFLRRSGCATLQGYLLGRPMEAADIPGFLRRLRSTVDSIDNDGSAAQTTRPPSGAERGEYEIGGKGSATGREA